MTRLGVLVNPIAGMGGRVGLHGTDGAALDAAIRAGAEPMAGRRMRRALDRLRTRRVPDVVLVAGVGMGADLLPPGWRSEIVNTPGAPTTAGDTRSAAGRMADLGVDLILFGGGDGTAWDVAAAVGGRVPVLGVPCGVKMHSGVFASGPEAAADIAARHLESSGAVAVAEIVDRTADGVVVLGAAMVPALATGVVRAKSVIGPVDDAESLGRAVAAGMVLGRLYLLGPGTTVGAVGSALGVPTSVNGVDAVLDGRLVASDASEAALLALLAERRPATLILGVVGGQGFLLGRGNQQLSPAVLDEVGTDNIEIVSSAGKIAALDPPVLYIDLDDPQLSARLAGYRRVRTSRRRSTVLRVVA